MAKAFFAIAFVFSLLSMPTRAQDEASVGHCDVLVGSSVEFCRKIRPLIGNGQEGPTYTAALAACSPFGFVNPRSYFAAKQPEDWTDRDFADLVEAIMKCRRGAGHLSGLSTDTLEFKIDEVARTVGPAVLRAKRMKALRAAAEQRRTAAE